MKEIKLHLTYLSFGIIAQFTSLKHVGTPSSSVCSWWTFVAVISYIFLGQKYIYRIISDYFIHSTMNKNLPYETPIFTTQIWYRSLDNSPFNFYFLIYSGSDGGFAECFQIAVESSENAWKIHENVQAKVSNVSRCFHLWCPREGGIQWMSQ